jgi:hypothetical protein
MIENNKFGDHINKLKEAITLLIGIDGKLPKGVFNKEHIAVMQAMIDVDRVSTILQENEDLDFDQFFDVFKLFNRAIDMLNEYKENLCKKVDKSSVIQSILKIDVVKSDISYMYPAFLYNIEGM